MKKRFLIIYLVAILLGVLVIGIHIFKIEFGHKFKFVKPKHETSQVYAKTVNNYEADTIWCGTFQLAWNELMDYVGGNVEFEDVEKFIVNELNERKFTKDMISENSYYVKAEKASKGLKEEIDNDLKQKFNIEDGAKILEGQELENSNGIVIYSMLKKNFTFLEKFDDLEPATFIVDEENSSKVKVFGIDEESDSKLYDNVEVLYWDYESVDDQAYFISKEFAVKLKTKENEEVILYRTDKEDNFENLYNELENLSGSFEGEKKFTELDTLTVPCIDIDVNITYDELCNNMIKNTDGEYISKAVQNIKFNLNSEGGLIFSEAAIITDALSAPRLDARYFSFNKPFIIFVKEVDKEKPYFAMKIENTEYLQIEE